MPRRKNIPVRLQKAKSCLHYASNRMLVQTQAAISLNTYPDPPHFFIQRTIHRQKSPTHRVTVPLISRTIHSIFPMEVAIHVQCNSLPDWSAPFHQLHICCGRSYDTGDPIWEVSSNM